jgi:colicin import membrane protein
MRIQRLLLLCFSLSLSFSMIVWAQTPAYPQPQALLLEEAHTQRMHAEVIKSEAEQRYASEQAACYQKFLVNDCLEAARSRHTQSLNEARVLDKAGRDVEREAYRQEVEAKEARRAAAASQRAAEQQAQAEAYRAAEADKTAERERKLAEKTKQAEEGRKRIAAEQAARREKLDKRAKDF